MRMFEINEAWSGTWASAARCIYLYTFAAFIYTIMRTAVNMGECKWGQLTYMDRVDEHKTLSVAESLSSSPSI